MLSRRAMVLATILLAIPTQARACHRSWLRHSGGPQSFPTMMLVLGGAAARMILGGFLFTKKDDQLRAQSAVRTEGVSGLPGLCRLANMPTLSSSAAVWPGRVHSSVRRTRAAGPFAFSNLSRLISFAIISEGEHDGNSGTSGWHLAAL